MSTNPPPDSSPPGNAAQSPEERSRITYFWDRIRGGGQGIIETCWRVFALLIAIRIFAADESVKQFIPVGLGIGFFLTPLTLAAASRYRGSISHLLGMVGIGIAGGMAMMLAAPNIYVFVTGVMIAQISAGQGVPLITHLYARNYRPHERGGKLATTFLIGSLLGAVFGYLGGELLDWRVEAWPLIFGIGVLAGLISAVALARIPAEPATRLTARNPLRSMAIVWQDKLFGFILFAWMLMGLGNLMQIPLRVEYLANPQYGINASNAQISAILVSTVLVCRLLSTKVWGWLFDRFNVITLRIALNLLFTISIACFFFTENLWLMAVGSALLGTAFGGGGIMWNLYVTKIAPPERVAAYMSVHSFLTGIRMAAAPFIGYALMEMSHPSTAAWFAMCLVGISTLLFLPMRSLLDKRAL